VSTIDTQGRCFVAASLLAACGCGMMGAGQVEAPSVRPAAAAAAAISALDTNGDGRLDDRETAACGSLRSVAARWDADADTSLSQSEIEAGLTQMFSAGVGLVNVSCRITNNGRSVPNAEVRFVPEDFLGGAVKAAAGTTDANGVAAISIPAADRPADQQDLDLMQVGLYQVEITGPGITPPAKPLGWAVDPTDRGGTSPSFDLAKDGR
jgi:hypothetical protein